MSKSPEKKAGLILYEKRRDEEPLVLLISSRKYPGSWVFPVGTVKSDESLAAAAARECLEETGYTAVLEDELVKIEIPQKKDLVTFTFFLAKPTSRSDDWEKDRQCKWIPLSELTHSIAEVFLPVASEAVDWLGSTD